MHEAPVRYPEAHNPERATSMRSRQGVFTNQFIFRTVLARMGKGVPFRSLGMASLRPLVPFSWTWGDTKGLHCKYPGRLHTIPYNFVIRNCMEPSRRLFFISLGAADFVTYDQREVFFPTPFCQENVIIWKQTRHDRVGRPKPAKIKSFSSSSFVSMWSK